MGGISVLLGLKKEKKKSLEFLGEKKGPDDLVTLMDRVSEEERLLRIFQEGWLC